MRKHEVIMKMHNDNGVLYRKLYEKDPYRYKRRIFIPTTGLNNIRRSPEDIIADKVEELIEGIKNKAEEFVRSKEEIEGKIIERLERDKELNEGSFGDKLREFAREAVNKLFND